MTNASPASACDDVGFELYDLRVEVVGPTDRPIYSKQRMTDPHDWMSTDAQRC